MIFFVAQIAPKILSSSSLAEGYQNPTLIEMGLPYFNLSCFVEGIPKPEIKWTKVFSDEIHYSSPLKLLKSL